MGHSGLAATVGSLAGLAVFLFAGEKVRRRLMADREAPSEQSRVREFADRYGPRGLGSWDRSSRA